MSTAGISLGWNCHSAGYGVAAGIRKRKSQGYNTCPFDEMITNYPGIVQCIDDGLDSLYDTSYLDLKKLPCSKWLSNETIIHHTKYNFLFNHESPYHANLYIKQNWIGGANHYIANNFEKFVERYKRRVNNLHVYLNSDQHVTFILTRHNTATDDVHALKQVLHNRYPNLNYSMNFQNFNSTTMHEHMLLMGVDASSEEVTRLL